MSDEQTSLYRNVFSRGDVSVPMGKYLVTRKGDLLMVQLTDTPITRLLSARVDVYRHKPEQ